MVYTAVTAVSIRVSTDIRPYPQISASSLNYRIGANFYHVIFEFEGEKITRNERCWCCSGVFVLVYLIAAGGLFLGRVSQYKGGVRGVETCGQLGLEGGRWKDIA